MVRPIVAVMSTPAEAVEGTVAYLTICFVGIPCITAYNVISSVFRGMGDSKSPMYFIAIACGANIAFDYIFMGGIASGTGGGCPGNDAGAGSECGHCVDGDLEKEDGDLRIQTGFPAA